MSLEKWFADNDIVPNDEFTDQEVIDALRKVYNLGWQEGADSREEHIEDAYDRGHDAGFDSGYIVGAGDA